MFYLYTPYNGYGIITLNTLIYNINKIRYYPSVLPFLIVYTLPKESLLYETTHKTCYRLLKIYKNLIHGNSVCTKGHNFSKVGVQFVNIFLSRLTHFISWQLFHCPVPTHRFITNHMFFNGMHGALISQHKSTNVHDREIMPLSCKLHYVSITDTMHVF